MVTDIEIVVMTITLIGDDDVYRYVVVESDVSADDDVVGDLTTECIAAFRGEFASRTRKFAIGRKIFASGRKIFAQSEFALGGKLRTNGKTMKRMKRRMKKRMRKKMRVRRRRKKIWMRG